MKTNCEGCGLDLSAESEAYFCSYECTFCPQCYSTHHGVCPNCAGELLRRPRRSIPNDAPVQSANPTTLPFRRGSIWLISSGIWIFVALAAVLTIWQTYRGSDREMPFNETFWLEMSQILTFIPLTPFAFAFAVRYPMEKSNWRRRSLLYFAVGTAFCVAHIMLRGLTPYAIWDSKHRAWTSALWNYSEHTFQIRWSGLRSLFLNNVVDDITGVFLPIVLVAHAISYYRKFQERELRASQLKGQLAKAHLQSLKSQLQPHFLFNTMHSISALMLTDVQAADRMITRLGDLLRLSLESAGTQLTTLSRELDFVNCYLEIEKVRFEERLMVDFDIAAETLDAQVPVLILQPLVDNAVKHGISQLPAGGRISISSSCYDGVLYLKVEDNGPGFANSDEVRGCGLGLKVTRDRLETLYGQNQSMELSSPPEGGVSTRISIPLRASPEAVANNGSFSNASLDRLHQ